MRLAFMTVVLLGLSVLGNSAHATFLLQFDENGNGTIQLSGGAPTPIFGTMQNDPSSTLGLVLTYFLPQPVVSGTILIPETAGGATGDAIRFTDNTGAFGASITGAGTRMIFYSLAGTDLADTGLPSNILSGSVTTGPAEVNGIFDYRPGGVAFPTNNEYIGISDGSAPVRGVPEPISLAVFGAGLAMLGVMRRKRKAS